MLFSEILGPTAFIFSLTNIFEGGIIHFYTSLLALVSIQLKILVLRKSVIYIVREREKSSRMRHCITCAPMVSAGPAAQGPTSGRWHHRDTMER